MAKFATRLLEHLEEWLLGAALAFMAGGTFVQVVARAWGRSISFSEEINTYLLVWITMLGIAAAAKRGAHIRVHSVSLLFPRLRQAQMLLAAVCCCALFAVLVWYGGEVVLESHTKMRTPALNWPMWWVGMSIPIGGALAMVRTVQACWRGWSRRAGDAQEGGE